MLRNRFHEILYNTCTYVRIICGYMSMYKTANMNGSTIYIHM